VIAVPSGTVLVVVDGIGSVPEALIACGTVLELLRDASHGVLASGSPLMRRCHERLIETRGALVALALIDAEEDLVRWVAVGGVAGLLIRAGPRARPPTEVLHGRDGRVGVYLPLPHKETVPIAHGDALVMTSDGIRGGYERGMPADVPPAPHVGCVRPRADRRVRAVGASA
jgi:negative regulator of sigma-B (phosphoserine phosphatase)